MFTSDQVKSLNGLELGVYQYIIQHQAAVPYMRIRELAAEAHVSTTTVLRFCKKVDCDGFAEFKYRMKLHMGQKDSIQVPDDLDDIQVFLGRLKNNAYQEQLDKASGLIAKAGRVLCVGIGSSGYVAQHAARFFTNFGKFSFPLTDPCYPVQNLDDKTETVAVVFSISGESKYAVEFARNLKKYGCSMICISNTDQNTIARLSDLTLPYFITRHSTQEGSGMIDEYVDFTSQVPAVILAELLAKRLARRLDEE